MSITDSGQPVKFEIKKCYWVVCCDCGLTHLVTFDIVNKKTVEMTMYRDDWETRKERKAMSDSQLDNLIRLLRAEKRRRKRNEIKQRS